MDPVPEHISPSQRLLLPELTASSLIWHNHVLPTVSDGCERAALEKGLPALVRLCPSFAQGAAFVHRPCHSTELCCWLHLHLV